MGGVKSEFQFISYKIDRLELSMIQDVGLLGYPGPFIKHTWKQSISIRNPMYFADERKYVGGIDTKLKLRRDDDGTDIVTLKAGIAGLFEVEEGFDKDVEKQLVLIHIPAILYPYIRATITALMGTAGFGSVILPLINLHEIAKETEEKIEIKVVKNGVTKPTKLPQNDAPTSG